MSKKNKKLRILKIITNGLNLPEMKKKMSKIENQKVWNNKLELEFLMNIKNIMKRETITTNLEEIKEHIIEEATGEAQEEVEGKEEDIEVAIKMVKEKIEVIITEEAREDITSSISPDPSDLSQMKLKLLKMTLGMLLQRERL